MAGRNLNLTIGSTAITIGARHVKFDMETDHIHDKLYVKVLLYAQSYKPGDSAKPLGYI